MQQFSYFNEQSNTNSIYTSYIYHLASYYGFNVCLIESFLEQALITNKLFASKLNLSKIQLEEVWFRDCEAAFLEQLTDLAA
jgi:hypothetical protein